MTAIELLTDAGVPLPPYIEHADGCRTVAEWASRAGVHRKALCRIMKRTGCRDPYFYVRLIRLIPAFMNLREGVRLMDVATPHYSDAYTFSDACLRVTGVRPGALRGKDWRAVVRQAAS